MLPFSNAGTQEAWEVPLSEWYLKESMFPYHYRITTCDLNHKYTFRVALMTRITAYIETSSIGMFSPPPPSPSLPNRMFLQQAQEEYRGWKKGQPMFTALFLFTVSGLLGGVYICSLDHMFSIINFYYAFFKHYSFNFMVNANHGKNILLIYDTTASLIQSIKLDIYFSTGC